MRKTKTTRRTLAEPVPAQVANPQPASIIPAVAYNQGAVNDIPERKGDAKVIFIETQAVGSSGTKIYGGYFSEEYLINTLYGQQAADMYDKMRRSDSNVRMLLNAVKSPIKAANWEIEPADDTDEAREQAEFVEHVLFHGMDKPFRTWVNEALTAVEFGFAPFEVTHKIVQDHPKWGTYIGIRQLGWRSPRSILRWQLRGEDGSIEYIQQLITGDLQRYVQIPGEYVIVVTIEKEGDNYEGVSLLRAAYGAWQRKQMYLKLMAIGMERLAVPAPVIEVPSGQQTSVEYTNMVNAARNWTSHQNAFLTIPAGWKWTMQDGRFQPEACKAAVDLENTEMTRAFLANFLELGITSSGSGRALSMDLSLFFLGAIQHIADEACMPINHRLIPDLIDMKYGKQEAYPKMKVSGIADKAGKELADSLKALAESQIIQPDDRLEGNMRKRMGLPEKSDQGVRIVQAPKSMQQGDNVVKTNDPEKVEKADQERADQQHAEGRVTLASSAVLRKGRQARALIATGKQDLLKVMKENLVEISEGMIGDILAAAKKLPNSRRRSATSSVEPKGTMAYKAALKDALSSLASKALQKARAEIPGKRTARLTEFGKGVKLSEFDKLPPNVQSRITEQSQLLVDSQMADLKKALFFQFGHSIDSTGDPAVLEQDLEEAGDNYIDGPAPALGASNSSSVTVNESRNAFFFDDDVLEDVQSFQFVNGDPVCPLCQDLNGSVFTADDAEASRYYPPLHHNCACILVPILKSEDEKEVTGLKPSKASLEDYITFGEGLDRAFRFHWEKGRRHSAPSKQARKKKLSQGTLFTEKDLGCGHEHPTV